MKGCLKLSSPLPSPAHTPGIDGQAPPNAAALGENARDHQQQCSHRKCVAFGAQITEEVYTADEWDRTPTEPARKLTYQDLLELKEIQRSLPRANQPRDLLSGRPSRHYLSAVPIGLLPLLQPDSSDESLNASPQPGGSPLAGSPRPSSPVGHASSLSQQSQNHNQRESTGQQQSPWAINFQRAKPPPASVARFPSSPTSPISSSTPTSPTATSAGIDLADSYFPFPPQAQRQPQRHLAHLLPARPAPPRAKPVFSFLPLLDFSSPTSESAAAKNDGDTDGEDEASATPEPPSDTDTDVDTTDAETDTDPPTPALTFASLDSDTCSSRASSCEPEALPTFSSLSSSSLSLSSLANPPIPHTSLYPHSHLRANTYPNPPIPPSIHVNAPPTVVTFKRSPPPQVGVKDPRDMFAAPRPVGYGGYGGPQGYGGYGYGQQFAKSPTSTPTTPVPQEKPAGKMPKKEKKKRNFIVVNGIEMDLDDDDDGGDDNSDGGDSNGAEEAQEEKAAGDEEPREDTALSIPNVKSSVTPVALLNSNSNSTPTSTTPVPLAEDTALSETHAPMPAINMFSPVTFKRGAAANRS